MKGIGSFTVSHHTWPGGKVSTSRVEDQGIESRFLLFSHFSDLKSGAVSADLPGIWC